MNIESSEKNYHVLHIIFSANEEEVNNLRTCISSFIINMSMICETMKEFGN